MTNPVLTYSNEEFPVIQKFDSGEYIYFFDRNQTIIVDENNTEKTIYSAIAIEFGYQTPVYKDAVEKVIRKYLSSSEEFDLINSAYLGEDEKYIEWLNKLQDIKKKIKADFQ